jgi:hypothetical protein
LPDRSAWTGQTGQDRDDRMPGHEKKDWTAGTGELWTRAMVQDGWGQDRRDRIDGQDRRDRTDRTGQIGQDNRDGTTVAGQSRYGS